MRSFAARQFDRNCVLAATAGQIAACIEIDIPITAIKVGLSTFNVGIVAHDIRVGDLPDAKAMVVALSGSVGFHRAASVPLDGLVNQDNELALIALDMATVVIDGWTADGRLKALVRTLDTITMPGDLTELDWLKVLKGH